MNWLYRTVLFEFKKDGLLGDRYIDDLEMEKVLNEYGGKGWELVSVTPVQEGLLAFFKRALPQPGTRTAAVKPATSTASSPGMAVAGRPVPQKPVSTGKAAVTSAGRPAEKPGRLPDPIGGIKIS